MNKLKKLYDLVKQESLSWDKRESVPPYQTWQYHILPVIENAIKFAKQRGGDVELVEAAALFHDYGSFVDDCKHYKEHHIVGGDRAEPILREFGYSQDFINKVKRCIFAHRGSVLVEKSSVEEICVADADAVSHIENVFQLIMWMGQRGDTVKDGNEFVKQKIKKSYAKLSDEAKEYVKDKYEAALKIFY